MKIGFDAKRAIQNFTGLGNYSRFVISNLIEYYPKNTYKLFSSKLPDKVNKSDIPQDKVEYSIKNTRKPFWRTFGITKNIKEANIDIYHGLSNELPYGIDKTGVKSVVTIHDLIFLNFPQYYPLIDRKIYNIKAKYASKIADRIVAVSECTKRDIIKYYNIPAKKIDVVYQGCFPIFKEKASEGKKLEVKTKYNLPNDFLLSVGSIEDRKNILLVVKALKQIPDIHFIAIGKKRKYADKVLQYAEENGLSDRVHLISNVPLADLPAILQSCKIFIYPSLYEGFGIPIIEALNSAVPVIGATGSCLEEAGGPDSIYVNPYDDTELAMQVNKLLNNAEARGNMVRKGLEYVQRFSDLKCTEDMQNVYNKLLC